MYVRIQLLSAPLEREEGEFAYIAENLLSGISPFHTAYTMKLPGTALLYAVSMSVFGAEPHNFKIGFIIISFCTSILIVFLTKRWTQNIAISYIDGIFYTLLAVGIGVYGHAAHATHFVFFLF